MARALPDPRWAVPGYAAGTVITYGGANYTLQSNGTMILWSQGGGFGSGGGGYFQIPSGYSSYAIGSVITYGGANYIIGANGRMKRTTGGGYNSNYVANAQPARLALWGIIYRIPFITVGVPQHNGGVPRAHCQPRRRPTA